MVVTLVILALSAVFFVSGKIRSDVVALCALVLLLLFHILTPDEALSGFSNSVVIMMIGLFVVGGVIFQTGLAKMISGKILQLAGKSETRLFILVMLVTSAIGAFVSNTGTVALMLPIVVSLAANAHINSSRLLMPLAFASSMGGMMTLIGTPPNLVIQNALTNAGFEPLTFFSFLPVGLICVFVGMVVLMPLSKIFLTKRGTEKSDGKNKNKSLNELAREYQLSENLFRIQIPEKSIIAGKTIVELNIRQQYHLNILEVRRSVSSQSRLLKMVNQKLADPGTVLRSGDVLYVNGDFEKVREFVSRFSLVLLDAHTIEDGEIKYRRSSLYSMMINHEGREFGDEIKDVFLKIPVPDKYNNHDLSVKVIYTSEKKLDKNHEEIDEFIRNNGIASRMVGRWFNRDYMTGVCDVELVKERGLYNASELDKALASKTQRGNALLEDAGEDLIGNTFLIVNDIRYIDRSKGSSVWGGIVKGLGAAAAIYTGETSYMDLGNSTGDIVASYKGFKVNIDTYLYQLVWDEETATKFYTQYYTDKDNKEKVNAFNNNRKMFKLKYVGSQHSDGSNTSFLGINLDEPQQMVRKACQRAIDENIASLQKNFDQFKVNTPLISVSPLKAYIGLKEGVTEKSKFEVLEAELSKEGKMTYKRVGVIQPKENLIWDNRYMASEEQAYGSDFGFTTFRKVSGGDFYPGMLIREIK